MEDLTKRKRPHATASVNRDKNENRLSIKRLKNRPQPSEMGDHSNSSTSSCESTGAKLNASLNGTEQIQSKLGKLHLTQAPETTKRLHFGDCISSPCNPTNKRSRRMENFDGQDQATSSKSNVGNSSCQYETDLLNTSSTPSTERRMRNGDHPDLIPDELKFDNNWSSLDLTQNGSQELNSPIFTQREDLNVSRFTLPYDDNQNNIALPTTSSISNLNPSVGNMDSLFSVSPDMNELLNYSGLPLMPIFARRSIGDAAQPVPFQGGFSSFDDEGFDEPNDSNGTATAMNSDVEEDFTL